MAERISLHAIDITIIAVYIIILVGLGIFFATKRKMKTADDLFLGGRKLKWYNIGLSIFSTNVSPMMLVGYCGIAYSTGMVAANFDWLAWWFLVLLAMIFIPHYFTTRVSTMPEFLLKRYGARSHAFLSYYTLFSTLTVWVSFVLFTGGIVIAQILGIPFWIAVIAIAALATSYTAIGGLEAVVKTGVVQSVVVTVATIAVGLIALNKIGGIGHLLDATPKNYWTIFRPASDEVYPWHAVILGYPVIGIWYWCTDQTIVQRVLAAKSIEHGQYGSMLVAVLKVFIPFVFLVPGIYCFVLYPNLQSSDHAYVTMIANLLPIGMIGLALAALTAALINDVAVGLNAFSTVFTLDVYVKKFSPGSSEKTIKRTGRIVMVLSAASALVIALLLSHVDKGLFDLSQSVGTYLAPPLSTVFILGVLWRKATSHAANLTLFIGSAICLTLGIMQITDYPHKDFWPHYMLLSFYMMCGLVLFMIIISLLYPEKEKESHLPTLAETYAKQPPYNRQRVWAGWIIIAALMFCLYVVFG
jgi:solute:Na+ symporter, SSS family